MFKEQYRAIYDQVRPDSGLISESALSLAKKRRQANRLRRLSAITVASVVSLVITFVLLVNLSLPFAIAMQQIPIMRGFVGVVALSPSIEAAVEHDYFQHIGQEQTVNGVTARVESIIVDMGQLHIFYSLQSEYYKYLRLSSVWEDMLFDIDGLPLGNYTTYSTKALDPLINPTIQENLRHLSFNFIDSEIPEFIIFQLSVSDWFDSDFDWCEERSTAFFDAGFSRPVAVFSFLISIDTTQVRQGTTIQIDRQFSFDGQYLTISSMEIFPTHIRLHILEDENNSAILKSLYGYLVDEYGTHFQQTGYSFNYGLNNVRSEGTFHFESSYFFSSQNLTVVITGATWLYKNAESTRIDLARNTAENLPPGVVFIDSKRKGDDFALTFSAPNREPRFYDPFFEENSRQLFGLFEPHFYDEAGTRHSFVSTGMLSDRHETWDTSGHLQLTYTPGAFGTTMIGRFAGDIIYLTPVFSHMTSLDAPIEIFVK